MCVFLINKQQQKRYVAIRIHTFWSYVRMEGKKFNYFSGIVFTLFSGASSLLKSTLRGSSPKIVPILPPSGPDKFSVPQSLLLETGGNKTGT